MQCTTHCRSSVAPRITGTQSLQRSDCEVASQRVTGKPLPSRNPLNDRPSRRPIFAAAARIIHRSDRMKLVRARSPTGRNVESEPPDHLPLCLWARPSSPPCVYFLADHLDAVLAAGEDMRKLDITWVSSTNGTQEETVRDLVTLRDSVDELRSLELSLIARLLKSRERAEELARTDARLKLMARLFLNGTGLITDALPELADATATDFNTGDADLAYLRARALIAPDAAAPAENARLRVTDAFPIARRLPLGALMDLVAQFLDTMELHHDIYTEQWNRLASASIEEATPAMSDKDKNPSPAPSPETDATRASTPPRKGYRSLTAALAELEEQERARHETATAS